MYLFAFSRSAISKLQAIIILIIIIAAAATSYVYASRFYTPAQPTPTPTPYVTASPSPQPTSAPTTLKLSNLIIEPTEAWPGQPVNASVTVSNTGTQNISYSLPFSVDGKVAQSVNVDLAAGTSETVTALVTENSTGTYQLTVGEQSGQFAIVPAGEYTIHYISNPYGLPVTLDGVSHIAPFSQLVTSGPHTLVVPANAQLQNAEWGLVNYAFENWDDGTKSLSRTVNVQEETYAVTNYIRTTTSCPILNVWNGTGYSYVAEVNDGTGWLGYLEYFQPDGSMVFSYNYPYDYIKLDSTQLQPLNGFYNFQIAEDIRRNLLP